MRFWQADIKGNQLADQEFEFSILPDDAGQSLRMQFEINATYDPRYYSGTIRIYNLDETKRDNLAYNLLLDEFGKGPKVLLTAGYTDRRGIIFDGVVHRGYSVREPLSGDWITNLQVGLPFKSDQEINIQPETSAAISTNTGLFNYLKKIINKVFNQSNRFSIKFAPNFDENLSSALEKFLTANTFNSPHGYQGNAINIIDEISKEFNLLFTYDNTGINVASGRYKEQTTAEKNPVTIPDNTTVPEITINKNTGLIGSPIYTDTGAKIISYLRPELRVFQFIRVESSALTRNISITELIHRGDTHTDEWYSEIDGSNFNQFIK